MSAGPLEVARTVPWSLVVERACRADPAIWAREKRGFENAPHHEEWYRLMRTAKRLAVAAPREHAKTEVFTVNQTAWRSIYQPGIWTYVFASTLDQGKGMKARIDEAIREAKPELVDNAWKDAADEAVYSNGSRITVAGAGKAVRSAHPDIIIGDDVLEEETCLTSYQRQKTSRWWFGTVSNMAHPGDTRTWRGVRRRFAATKVFLVGTPFHGNDLLLGMRSNPLYRFYRYAAEFRPEDLVEEGSLAVEAA